jgi:capsular exopolysaccharide synthesis family protein
MSAILGLSTSSGRSAYSPRLISSERRRISVDPGRDSRLVYLTESDGLAVERYRLLRRRLYTVHPEGGVLLVTSPAPGEGKTLTSVNLSWALAEAGHRTCLVDLDFRAPGVSRTLQYAFDDGGVQEILEEKADILNLVCQLGEHPLHVLGIKHRLASPGYLFYSPAMPGMVARLRAAYKWVVLDFAPVIPMADVSEMIPHINGAILVVRTGKTKKDMLEPALEVLEPKLWGVVANDCSISGSAYYGYYGKQT